VLWRSSRLTKIRSISSRELCSDQLYVAGDRGLAVVSHAGKFRSYIEFDAAVGTVVPVGRFELMNQGGAWQPVSLMDSKGRTLWSVDGPSTPNHMTAADLDGDGSLDFLIGFNGMGGVARLDARGRTVWTRPATNVWTVAVVDTDGDGAVEIMHCSHRDGGIVVRNGDGEKLRVLDATSERFCVTTWPGVSDSPALAYSHRDSLHLASLAGEPIRRLPLPVDGHAVNQAIPVRWRGGVHFAAVRTITATGRRSALFLYEPAGELIYTEIFAASSLALATIPDRRTGTETLLVGAGSEVFAYRLAD